MRIPGTYIISEAECIREGNKSILVDAPDFDESEWIFKDQILDESEVKEPGDTGDLIITRSFAKRQGWV